LGSLTLKAADTSRLSGQWSDDDYDVLENGVVAGRIFLSAAPRNRPWMWASGHNGKIRRAAYGYEPTREAAMAAFAKSWPREWAIPFVQGGRFLLAPGILTAKILSRGVACRNEHFWVKEEDWGVFGPEDIATMTTAFDRLLADLKLIDPNDPVVTMLAKLVIEIVRNGERDPEQVRKQVLGRHRPTERRRASTSPARQSGNSAAPAANMHRSL
jgi:hypothetical protein